MATEVVHTIAASGGDYTSIAAWEAAQQRNLVTADEIAVAEISGTVAMTADEDFSAWTTDANRYFEIRSKAGEEPDGLGGGATLDMDCGYGFQPRDNYWRMTALNVDMNNSASFQYNHVSTGEFRVDRLYMMADAGSFTGGTGKPQIIKNSVIRRTSSGAIFYGASFTLENVTAITGGSNGICFQGTSQTNCVGICTHGSPSYQRFYNCTGGSNNASDDWSAYGANSITNIVHATEFQNPATDDWRLASGSQLTTAGADLGDASAYTSIEQNPHQLSCNEVWPIGASQPIVEEVSAIRSSGGDYTTLSAWEAAQQRDLVTADEIAIAELYNDWSGDGLNDPTTLGAWTTDATRRIVIRAASGEEHDGTPLTGARIQTTTGYNEPLKTGANNVTIEGIESKSASGANSYAFDCNNSTNDTVIRRCIFTQTSSTKGIMNPYRRAFNMHACLLLSTNGAGSNVSGAGYVSDRYIQNCTFAQSGTGGTAIAIGHSETVYLKNCVVYGGWSADLTLSATRDAICEIDYNATSFSSGTSGFDDTEADVSNSVYNIAASDFLDAANDDYHLSGSSSLIDAGLNLYDSGDLSPVEYDIDGEAMPATTNPWNIGADEREAAGGEDLTAATETDAAVALVEQVLDALTVATETDAAVALSASLAAALTIGTETDAAVALVEQVLDALTVATETDSAVALSASLTAALSAAAEVDQATALLPGSGPLPLAAATETDQAITLATKTTLAVAAETDAAVALAAADVLALGVAGETDAALALTGAMRKALAAALEKDAAAILVGETAISPGLEVDSAVPLIATGTHTFITGNNNRWVLTPRGTTFTLDARSPVFDYLGGDSQSARFRGRDTE